MFNSLLIYGLEPTRLLCPWDSPGKNTGMGCCCLLQEIVPNQGSNPRLFCLLHWQAGSLSEVYLQLFPQKVLMDCSVMVMPCLVNSKIPQVQGKDVRRSFSRVKYVVHLLLLLDFNFPKFLVFWIFASQRPAVTRELLWLDLVTLDIDSEISESAMVNFNTCIEKM